MREQSAIPTGPRHRPTLRGGYYFPGEHRCIRVRVAGPAAADHCAAVDRTAQKPRRRICLLIHRRYAAALVATRARARRSSPDPERSLPALFRAVRSGLERRLDAAEQLL